MLKKIKKEPGTPVCGQNTFKFLARMTKGAKSSSSPYKKMESEGKESRKKIKKADERDEMVCKGKENNKTLAKEVKEKKSKKKGWKRVRQVALTTCRYIGMGAAHMSPATVYSSPDYYVDPKYWNRSFSSSYKPKVPVRPSPPPHWTTTMMFSSW